MTESGSPLKQTTWIHKHRFALLFFLYLVCYHVVVVNRLQWQMNNVTYAQYCVDFSFGFASKLLPGAIFRFLFGKHATMTTATIYASVLVLIIFLGVSFILEKFMRRVPATYQGPALFLLLFFLSGAYTFSIYTKWLGLLDTGWLLITLLFFVFLEHRRLRFLIPALYALSLLIHFSALVFFLTIFSILLLYRMSVTSEKREKAELAAVFAVSLCITFGLFFWVMLNEGQMICSMEEFHKKLQENGTDYFFYHDYAFFRIWSGRSFVPDSVRNMQPSLSKFFHLFYYQVKLVYDLLAANPTKGLISTAGGTLILLPMVVAFSRLHWECLKKGENRLRRFCAFLMLVQFPFVYVLGLLFATSVDMTRYLSHAFLGMFICVLAVLYFEEEVRSRFFERAQALAKSLPVKVYFLAYAAINLSPSL